MNTAYDESTIGPPKIGRLLIATQNEGKIREFRRLISPLGLEVIALNETKHLVPPEETGASFADNAALKASYYARLTGQWAIADDSGLEVDALDGAPSVRSSRFWGDGTSDKDRVLSLLKAIEASGSSDRTARFVCVIALANPEGEILISSEGICKGKIVESPRGSCGFGYDPVFSPEGDERTFAEMTAAEKDLLSHRSIAFCIFIRKFRDFMGL